MAFSKKFVAWCLSKSEKIDKEIYGEKKKNLFKKLKGTILEIGPGTGINLPYYPKNIKWVGIEPNKEMHKYIKKKSEKLKIKVEIKNLKAEKIPLKNSSADYVISTLVLCSVDSQEKTLSEIKRVLKKDGKFIFIEHVADKPLTLRRTIQNLAPYTPWKLFSDNCRPNRETWKTIEKSGLKKIKIKHFKIKELRFNPLTFLVRPHIIGEATK